MSHDYYHWLFLRKSFSLSPLLTVLHWLYTGISFCGKFAEISHLSVHYRT